MIEFTHRHTAHCESGVMSALLNHHGYRLDEAMVFGLASALTFVYMPVIKLAGMPLVSYRMPPRGIIRRICKTLGLRLNLRTFSKPEQGRQALDAALDAGQPVGLQTSVFWLPYFPPEMRFHFNAHNLLVYGRENGSYLISDPVFETVQRCPAEDLQRARFAKGALAPKGMMYTLDDTGNPAALPERLPALIRRAVRKNARHMLAPVFFAGVRGIRTVAARIEALDKPGTDNSSLAIWYGCRKKSAPAARASAIFTPIFWNRPPKSAANPPFRLPQPSSPPSATSGALSPRNAYSSAAAPNPKAAAPLPIRCAALPIAKRACGAA